MRHLVALLFLVVACLAPGQEWAKARVANSPRHLEWVEVKHDDRAVKALVAYPERKDKAPVVILIHEIFGMTDWVQSVADQFAEKGFIAIAPDLLSGMGPGGGRTDSFEVSKVREAIGALPPAQITADLNACFDYAKKIPSANGQVAVAGFCWGGSQTFRYATDQPGLSAAFVFYGTGPSDPAAVAKIKVPVYGFYGGNDNRVNATIEATTKLMADNKKSYAPVIYEGAGHGFMRQGEDPAGSEENKKARDEAWKRMLEILSNPSMLNPDCCEL